MESLDATVVGNALLESAWWTARISVAIAFLIWLAGAVAARRLVRPHAPAPHRLPGAGIRVLAQLAALVVGGALAALTRGEAERLLVPAAQAALCAFAAIAAPAGGLLSAWAARTLGPGLVFEAEIADGAPLVTSGPFGIVRHPFYLGLGLVLGSAGLALGSLSGTAVLVTLYFVASAWRARLEDRVLAQAFPDTHPAYAARVRMFVPRI